MKIFAINIVTETRDGDAFDAVAINKFPVIFEGTSAESVLSEQEFSDYLDIMIDQYKLTDKTKIYIREFTEDGCTDNIIDLNKLDAK